MDAPPQRDQANHSFERLRTGDAQPGVPTPGAWGPQSDPFGKPSRSAIDTVVVVVPVHNEVDTVTHALESVRDASRTSSATRVLVVVVLDDCDDGSDRSVSRLVRRDRTVGWLVVEGSYGAASSARGAGVGEALLSGCLDPATTALLSTDADSVVGSDWVDRHLAHLLDADAVAGTVTILGWDHGSAFFERWASEYHRHHREDGWHPHVHAANLSVRLDAYLRAGGFGREARAEDISLWRRLEEIPGVRRISDSSIVVATSGRLRGRVVGGFATALEQLSVGAR